MLKWGWFGKLKRLLGCAEGFYVSRMINLLLHSLPQPLTTQARFILPELSVMFYFSHLATCRTSCVTEGTSGSRRISTVGFVV